MSVFFPHYLQTLSYCVIQTFCSKCLQRSLDYGSNCPICRQQIPSFYFQDHPLNQTIMNISKKSSTCLLLLLIYLISSPQSLSSSLSRKSRCHRTGRTSRPSKHPDLCMPTQFSRCPYCSPLFRTKVRWNLSLSFSILISFRYRLMLRRCLESPTPFFGMIMPPKAGCPPVDYGTILEIKSVQMLPDGRSMVETWGSTRFRILERGFLDGYMVGRIER
jgi:hypothetical protein